MIRSTNLPILPLYGVLSLALPTRWILILNGQRCPFSVCHIPERPKPVTDDPAGLFRWNLSNNSSKSGNSLGLVTIEDSSYKTIFPGSFNNNFNHSRSTFTTKDAWPWFFQVSTDYPGTLHPRQWSVRLHNLPPLMAPFPDLNPFILCYQSRWSSLNPLSKH